MGWPWLVLPLHWKSIPTCRSSCWIPLWWHWYHISRVLFLIFTHLKPSCFRWDEVHPCGSGYSFYRYSKPIESFFYWMWIGLCWRHQLVFWSVLDNYLCHIFPCGSILLVIKWRLRWLKENECGFNLFGNWVWGDFYGMGSNSVFGTDPIMNWNSSKSEK